MAKAPSRAKARNTDMLHAIIRRLISEMEEPLREASQLTHVLSLVNVSESADLASIAFTATKVRGLLRSVEKNLHLLFGAVERKTVH